MIASILVFLLVLSILVVVHEFGHYWVAKRNGVWVEEFGFGIPPRVFGKKIGETIYSINLLPFGGFVRLHGEQSEDGVTSPKRAFVNKNKRVRIAVIIAGVVMNLFLAIVAFGIVYSYLGVPRESGRVKIVDIQPASPAVSAGLVVGDVIISVDGKEVHSSDDVTSKIVDVGGKHALLIESGQTENKIQKKVTVDTRQNSEDGKWYMGIVLTSIDVYYPPVWQRPFYGAYYGIINAYDMTKTVVVGLTGIAKQASHGQVAEGTVGPVGLFALVDYILKTGSVLDLINFLGIISINLAVINILPLPALDGGRLLFIGIESLFGRKVLPKVEGIVHSIGFIILISLLLLITVRDIKGIASAGGISAFIENLVK